MMNKALLIGRLGRRKQTPPPPPPPPDLKTTLTEPSLANFSIGNRIATGGRIGEKQLS